MKEKTKSVGYKLPVTPNQQQGTVAQGFVTPQQDKNPQIQPIPPKRVLPIIFIPGIMGSNLRMNAEHQQRLKSENNIAWRPDNLMTTVSQSNDSPIERQLRLDPRTTEVDTYDPINNPTGNSMETSDARNKEVQVNFLYSAIRQLDGPLLQADPIGTRNPKTADQKARERGWGEIYYDSYKTILSTCEHRLNAAFTYGSMDLFLQKQVASIDPSAWQANPNFSLKKIDEKIMRATVKACWFPVHAMGYNWLNANSHSGIVISDRIRKLIQSYKNQGFQCEKVILVTHSMGGLVARAVIHPDMGNLNNEVLGIVHGVMPALGAGTAYKRVRCGFEGSGISTKVLGASGTDVTAVLANSQGGLELLPSTAYGNHWLQVKHKGKIIRSLPQNGDPYEEIYKVDKKWFSLLRENWINPARLPLCGFKNSCQLLDRAKDFHAAIESTYHDNSYAHYGADPKRLAWHKVIWQVNANPEIEDIDSLKIVSDDAKGKINAVSINSKSKLPLEIDIKLLDAADPGDQTVPLHSADAQLRSGKFKGIFRQTGYEHQASYDDSSVVAATLYSLFQIASAMKWSN
nr:hypothetical protein [uncultured Massilia sp.]